MDDLDVSMTLQKLETDEKGTSLICTPGGNQEVLVINEPGMYSIILRSRKPEAKSSNAGLPMRYSLRFARQEATT